MYKKPSIAKRQHPAKGILHLPTPALSPLSGAEHLPSEQRQELTAHAPPAPCSRVHGKLMLRSPLSSPRGGKGWCRLCANLSPTLGKEETGILSQSSQTGSMGLQLAAAWSLCWVIIICMRIIMAREEKTPLKRCPAELPAPHAGCNPGSCQAACSPCLWGLSPAAGKGHTHTLVTGGSAAQVQEEPQLCGCPRMHPAALLPKEAAAQCFPGLQGGCRGSLGVQLGLGRLASVPPHSTAAPGMGTHCPQAEGRGWGQPCSPAGTGDTCTPGACHQQRVGRIQLMPLSPEQGPAAATGPPSRETCPVGCSGKGAPCSRELGGLRRTPAAGWTVTLREKLSLQGSLRLQHSQEDFPGTKGCPARVGACGSPDPQATPPAVWVPHDKPQQGQPHNCLWVPWGTQPHTCSPFWAAPVEMTPPPWSNPPLQAQL